MPAGRRRLRRCRATCSASSTSWTSLYAATSEMHDAAAFEALPGDARISARGIEVGHIFYFGTKYSEPMKARGDRARRQRACRSTWAPTASARRGWSPRIIEASHDEAGIIWPEAVAPFEVAIAQPQGRRLRRPMRPASSSTGSSRRRASTCSTTTATSGPGAKFATADLIGLPWQIIVGPKGLAEGKVELKRRADGTPRADDAGRRRRTSGAMTGVARNLCTATGAATAGSGA